MSTKHVGLFPHRLKQNPLEKKFAEAWAKIAPRTLGYLISTDNRDYGYSQEQATLAATLMQWLGSPVGESFVREVLKEKR